MEEQMKSNNLPEEQTVQPKKRGRYGIWIRLTALVLAVVIVLNFLTGVDFSLLRYQGTDQMAAAQYLMDSTPYLGESRVQRLKSLLSGVDSFSLNLQAAEIAIGKTDYERAVKFLNKTIPLSSDDVQKAELYNRLGCVYMLLENPVQAQQAFDSSIVLNPEAPIAYLLRAQLRYQSGDAAGATEDARKYLDMGGNDREMLLTASSLCELGGDLEGAAEAMSRKIQAEEEDYARASAYAERGRILYLMGRETEAAEDIKQAEEIDAASLNGVHYAIVALCQYNAGNYASSSRNFLLAAQLSKEGKEAYYEQAILCGYLVEDTAFMEKAIEEAKSKDQMTANSYLIEGTLLFSQERYEEAVTALTNSLATGTTVAGAHYYRGLSRLAMGEYEMAAEDFTVAMNWEEDPYGCIFNRGVCYYALDELEKAMADFRDVIANCADESLVQSAAELLESIENPEEE